MPIFFIIIVISVLALVVDYYIYRRVISRHNFGKLWEIGYLAYAFIVDTMVVTALLTYQAASDGDNSVMIRFVMWVIGLFFLNAVPKFVYAAVSLGDYLIQMRTKKVSHYFGYTGTFLALCVAGIMLHGMTYGRSDIRVTVVELNSDRLPASFDGFKVAHFSDVHLGGLVCRDGFLEKMVGKINGLEPDMIVNCGDLVNNHYKELDDAAVRILQGLKAEYGVYSVMGNHDLGIYVRDTVKMPVSKSVREVIAIQERMGWNVLRNTSAYIHKGGGSISVSGLDYPIDVTLNGVSGHSSRLMGADIRDTYRGVPDSVFNIAVTHAPQLWNELLAAGKGDLTLAGHVHAMQMKFSARKKSWSPAKFMYNRWSGLYEENGRYLYINDGMGYVMYPMRIGTKPEITLYVLRSDRANNTDEINNAG